MNAEPFLAGRVATVARRAAVAAVLAAASPPEQARKTSELASAALIDDFSVLCTLADELGASDAALACAAADSDGANNNAARICYAVRLRLRSGIFQTDEMSTVTTPADGTHRAAQACSTLSAALAALRARNAPVAAAPRGLLAMLGAMPNCRDEAPVLRLLRAWSSAGRSDLVAALAGEPFHVTAENAGQALTGRSGSPREVLSGAVARLRGGQAKDAAVCALSAFDALAGNGAQPWELGARVRAAHAVIGEASSARAGTATEEIFACADAADRAWAAGASELTPAQRAAVFLDSIAAVQLEGIQLHPHAGETVPALRFEDAPSSPVDIARFAQALGAGSELAQGPYGGHPGIDISATMVQATAAYFKETMWTEHRRTWPAPDTPIPLVAPAMTFSASRLNTYARCPRKFYFEYLCQVLEDPGSLHATYGRVMHDALEQLHRDVRFPEREDAAQILDRLLRALDAAFGTARGDFASQLEYETSRSRARRMAEQYVRWLAAESERAPMEIAGVEIFERRRFGAHDFVGYIDRIDKPLGGGAVTIYDYKTGRVETDARAYLAKVRSGDEAQLALYYAMRHAAGDRIARIALVSIRDPRADVWILALDVAADGKSQPVQPQELDGVLRGSCSREDLDASLAALLRRCELLTGAGVLHFPAGVDPPCSFCAYAQACRERPLEGERAFAR